MLTVVNGTRPTDSLERLAGFAPDDRQSAPLGQEAKTLLRLFKMRCADIDAREALRQRIITKLGTLSLNPSHTK